MLLILFPYHTSDIVQVYSNSLLTSYIPVLIPGFIQLLFIQFTLPLHSSLSHLDHSSMTTLPVPAKHSTIPFNRFPDLKLFIEMIDFKTDSIPIYWILDNQIFTVILSTPLTSQLYSIHLDD